MYYKNVFMVTSMIHFFKVDFVAVAHLSYILVAIRVRALPLCPPLRCPAPEPPDLIRTSIHAGPLWGYFKSQFSSGLSTFDDISPQNRTNGSKNEHGIPPRRAFCGHDRYSDSMKITTHLAHISHCKTASGTNWSTRWINRVFMINTRRD